ncbi:MAG: tyrosine-type recombinase/integrase [Pseudomonadota bacterium]
MISGIGWTSGKLADGSKVYYYRVSREPGAPRFWTSTTKIDYRRGPVPKDFALAYADTLRQWEDDRPARESKGDCEMFILQYLASDKFQSRSPVTQKQYRSMADTVIAEFGKASVTVLEDRRFKGRVVQWHEDEARRSAKMADDMVQVFSNALEYAYRRGDLMHNPVRGIEKAYKAPDDKRPIPQHELDAAFQGASQADADIMGLSLHTGLRATDLAQITWDADKGSHLEWATSKSRRTSVAVVPLTPEARAFLDDLRARQMGKRHGSQRTMLVGTRGRSMRPNTLTQRISKRLSAVGSDATLHRFRNSFVTQLVRAGFSDEEIAGAVGWSVATVADMKRVYVQREELVAAQVARLNVVRK